MRPLLTEAASLILIFESCIVTALSSIAVSVSILCESIIFQAFFARLSPGHQLSVSSLVISSNEVWLPDTGSLIVIY